MSLFSGGAYYWREFCVSKCVGLDNKNGLNHEDNSQKQLKTADSNSPCAYIREGLLSEGYLRLRFGGLICWRAYFWRILLSEFYGISVISSSPLKARWAANPNLSPVSQKSRPPRRLLATALCRQPWHH